MYARKGSKKPAHEEIIDEMKILLGVLRHDCPFGDSFREGEMNRLLIVLQNIEIPKDKILWVIEELNKLKSRCCRQGDTWATKISTVCVNLRNDL